MTSLELLAWLAVAFLAAACGLTLAARGKLRGTTLLWPWAWAVPVPAVWAVVMLWAVTNRLPAEAVLPWRYVAGVFSLAPAISLLGVRRPHHRAWQWVVLSLVGVLFLPLGHWALGGGFSGLRLHWLWQSFLLVLLILGWLHYGWTPHAPAALLVVAAQGLWLFPVLGPRSWHAAGWLDHLGGMALASLLLGAAVAWSWLRAGRSAGGSCPSSGAPDLLGGIERLLCDFRLWFGDFWFQRLRWQVMLAAQRAGWPVTITPTGRLIVERTAAEPGGWEQALHTGVEQFLRRFVSREWIQQRVSPHENQALR